MNFLSAVHTDIGISKKVNQDAFCLKVAKTPNANIAFAVMCDGMGGLTKGELASAYVVNAFSGWFENEFPNMFGGSINFQAIKDRWNAIALEQNQKIMNKGQLQNSSMGTTLTALLLVNNDYLFIHVGDSRIYRINSSLMKLTNDQTVVARDVAMKRITKQQALKDKRKNVLLQCVGASKSLTPEFGKGKISSNDVFVLCSDGFRHEVSSEELIGVLSPSLLTNERIVKKSLVDLVELNKSRGEKDNITVMLIKCINK